MRRAGAIVLLLVGAILLGLDLRPVAGADGVVRMAWSFFGAPAGAQPLAEFAARAASSLPWAIPATLVLACVLGWATARLFTARASAKVLCALAWAVALDPQIAYFVATRQPLSAERYLDVGDLFRALGLAIAYAGVVLALPRRRSEPARGDGSFASVAAAMAVAIVVPEVLSMSALFHHHLSNDEFAYLFQARLFARGELAHDAGALADFFPSVQTQNVGGRIFAIVFPGHSAMLVPGVWIGFPMLVPRLLAGLSVLLTWLVGRRLGVSRPAWGAWVLAISPAFLGVEALNLAHGTSLPFLLLFTWAALEAMDRTSNAHACLAGFAFSIAFAARPLTAVAIGVPVLALLVRERPRNGTRLVVCALAAAVPVALLFLEFDRRLTGSPFHTVYGTFMTTDVSVYGHIDVATAASISAFNLSRVSIWLVGLAPGLLLPVLAGPFRRRWFLAALPASLFAFYVLHPFHGIPWAGPVYLSDALPYLALLTAQGLVAVETAFGAAASRAAWAFFACGSIVLLAAHFSAASAEIAERQRPYAYLRKAGIDRGVVFLPLATLRDWRTYPIEPPEPGSALVFARDLGPRNAELVHALGDPPAWVWDPSSGELRAAR